MPITTDNSELRVRKITWTVERDFENLLLLINS